MKAPQKKEDQALHEIEDKADRMRRARATPPSNPLMGFGMFGMIGWSVAVPTIGGALLGQWLDRTAPQQFSWTVALLLAGVFVGAIVAWKWVSREGGAQ